MVLGLGRQQVVIDKRCKVDPCERDSQFTLYTYPSLLLHVRNKPGDVLVVNRFDDV
jgi:hypothetical protein